MDTGSLDSNWQVAISATDTVFGIVCRISEDEKQTKKNIERIYELKQRDKSKPLILFGSSVEVIKPYVKEWNETMEKLAQEHWAGALTMVVEKSDLIPDYINPGFDTIGIRVPKSPSIKKLLDQTENKVLLSTSANISGEKEIGSFNEAAQKFNDDVDLILEPDPEERLSNQASTIVLVGRTGDIGLLRQGNIHLQL